MRLAHFPVASFPAPASVSPPPAGRHGQQGDTGRRGALRGPRGRSNTSSPHLTRRPETSSHNLRKIKESLQGPGTTAPILKALTSHGSWQGRSPEFVIRSRSRDCGRSGGRSFSLFSPPALHVGCGFLAVWFACVLTAVTFSGGRLLFRSMGPQTNPPAQKDTEREECGARWRTVPRRVGRSRSKSEGPAAHPIPRLTPT